MKNCYFFGSLLLAGTAIMTVYAQSNVTPVPASADEEEELFLEDLIVDALPSPSYTGDAVDVAKWPTGMQMFEFVLSRPLVKNVDCEEPVTIYWEDEAMSFIYASNGENDNYAQPPFVQVEYFNPLDLDDENPSQSCTIRIVVSEDPIVLPGFYALEIPEGFFSTTDGEPVEGTMIFYDVINSASGQDMSAEPFSDYVVMSMPEANGIFNRMDSSAGVAMFQYFLNTGDKALSLNPDCKETLKLRAANGEVLSEISSGFDIASYMGDEFVPFAMVNPYGMGELGEEPQTVMIQFFADEYTESGKYYVEIPAGFFKAGDYEIGETMYSYTLVSGDVVASFSSMVYEAYPEYGVQLDVKDDRWAYYGIDCFNYSVEGYDNFAVNKECESPIMILQNGFPFCEIKADETSWTQPYAEVYSLKGFNDEPDADFGGNASGDDSFGVVADGQDPDFGGNASGDDNFGVVADGQDPDFGGNAS
ncbi:MAG: hypothetical protein K2O78_03650, partial [Muribaculaceae bacterium]|nr:hypothetical protein [Muribaculaceae bacterium]